MTVLLSNGILEVATKGHGLRWERKGLATRYRARSHGTWEQFEVWSAEQGMDNTLVEDIQRRWEAWKDEHARVDRSCDTRLSAGVRFYTLIRGPNERRRRRRWATIVADTPSWRFAITDNGTMLLYTWGGCGLGSPMPIKSVDCIPGRVWADARVRASVESFYPGRRAAL